MAKGTKDRILEAALTLFSKNGFSGTSMNDIASALGLSKAALYRHFESKDEIRIVLIDEMEEYYAENFGSENDLPRVPDSADGFYDLAVGMANFTLRDEKIKKVRMMLTLEQFESDRAADLATRHFITAPEKIFCGIIRGMMDNGLLKKDDPEELAFEYAVPVSSLIRLADRQPQEIDKVIDRIGKFTKRFIEKNRA